MPYTIEKRCGYMNEDGEYVGAEFPETITFDDANDMKAWAKRNGPWSASHYPLRADMPAPVGLWFETSAQIGVDIIAPAWVPDTAVERIITVRANAGDADDWHRAFLA